MKLFGKKKESGEKEASLSRLSPARKDKKKEKGENEK